MTLAYQRRSSNGRMEKCEPGMPRIYVKYKKQGPLCVYGPFYMGPYYDPDEAEIVAVNAINMANVVPGSVELVTSNPYENEDD